MSIEQQCTPEHTGRRLRVISALYYDSFADMARDLDISPNTFRNYTGGQRELPVWLAGRIQDKMEIPADFILFGITISMNDDLQRHILPAVTHQKTKSTGVA